MENSGNTTTNIILVILLIIVVAFVVWYATMRKSSTEPAQDNAGLEINIGGGSEAPNSY